MARSPISRAPSAAGLHQSLAEQSRHRRETLADIQTAEASRGGNGHPALDRRSAPVDRTGGSQPAR